MLNKIERTIDAVSGLVLVAAAISKFMNMETFISELRLPLFPQSATAYIGAWIPSVEITIGVALMLGVLARQAVEALLGLCVAFVLYHIWQGAVGERGRCNCFSGVSNAEHTWWLYAILCMISVFGVTSLVIKNSKR